MSALRKARQMMGPFSLSSDSLPNIECSRVLGASLKDMATDMVMVLLGHCFLLRFVSCSVIFQLEKRQYKQ